MKLDEFYDIENEQLIENTDIEVFRNYCQKAIVEESGLKHFRLEFLNSEPSNDNNDHKFYENREFKDISTAKINNTPFNEISWFEETIETGFINLKALARFVKKCNGDALKLYASEVVAITNDALTYLAKLSSGLDTYCDCFEHACCKHSIHNCAEYNYCDDLNIKKALLERYNSYDMYDYPGAACRYLLDSKDRSNEFYLTYVTEGYEEAYKLLIKYRG